MEFPLNIGNGNSYKLTTFIYQNDFDKTFFPGLNNSNMSNMIEVLSQDLRWLV